MAKNLTPVDVFSPDVTVPEGADPRTAASVELPFQQLTNRSINLDSRVDANLRGLDLVCAATLTQRSAGAEAIAGITYSATLGMWCAVGGDGGGSTKIYTSRDAYTWTIRTPGVGGDVLYAVHYAAGAFVAVGKSGTVQTSTDGVTWNKRTTPSAADLYGVTYDGTRWIAVGSLSSAAYVLTATDPTSTWTARTAPTGTTSLRAVASDGAGVAIAVGLASSGARGIIGVTTDSGTTWTTGTAPLLIGQLYAVSRAPDSGVYYAAGLDGTITRSDDSGSTWSAMRTYAGGSPGIYGLAACPGGLVVAARGGVTSDPADPLLGHDGGDGWRVATTPTSDGALCAYYAKGRVVIGLHNGGVVCSDVMGHRLETI